MADSNTAILLLVAALGVVAVGVLLVARKGRPFTTGDVFRTSRLSRGNHLLPTQVAITPTSVVQYTPQWIGHYEHSIHMAHVSSVGIDTHLLFADVYIETSGGSAPVRCHGHRKGDAIRMKNLVEQYQSAYYRDGRGTAPVDPGPVGR